MKPAPFAYHDPATVEDAVKLLGSLEDAKLLAGGQSLMPMLNMRFLQPSHVVDLNKVEALGGIAADGETIRIGAMARQRDLMRSELIAARMPVFREALNFVGHFQTRNRGTFGGSLCHLDPAAELPMVAALYDAALTVRGPEGERTMPFAEWPLAYMMPSIAPEEMLVEVRLPGWPMPHGHAFVEFSRRHGDFAIVAVACLLALAEGGETVARAALVVGGADQVVRRLDEVAGALAGQPADARTFRSAAEAAAVAIETMDDAYVSASYRTRLVRVLTERALATATERARTAPTAPAAPAAPAERH